MLVGICRFRLMLGNNMTLKGKRQVVQKLKARLQQKFNLAIGEVDDLDLHQRATMGFAIVGADYKQVDSALKKILNLANEICPGQIIDETFLVEQFTDEHESNELISEKWEFDEE